MRGCLTLPTVAPLPTPDLDVGCFVNLDVTSCFGVSSCHDNDQQRLRGKSEEMTKQRESSHQNRGGQWQVMMKV